MGADRFLCIVIVSVVMMGLATETVSTRSRPILSPIWQKITPPSGRDRKPAAKAPYDATREETGSSEGKNCVPLIAAR